jgi:hypothetical protein
MFKILIPFVISFACVRVCAQLSASTGADSTITKFVGEGPVNSIYNGRLTTSIKDKNKILVSWPCLDSVDVDYYSLERKTNESVFEVVGVIRRDSSLSSYNWLDEGATVGRHYYRLSVVTRDGQKQILAGSQVILSGATDIRFYPNPVDNVLIIRSSYPLEVVILDAQGMIKVPMFKVNGLITLPVSQLEKGIYYIRFQNKLTGLVSQERLVKN